jgi:hypothetical protein
VFYKKRFICYVRFREKAHFWADGDPKSALRAITAAEDNNSYFQ